MVIVAIDRCSRAILALLLVRRFGAAVKIVTKVALYEPGVILQQSNQSNQEDIFDDFCFSFQAFFNFGRFAIRRT